MSVWWFFFSFNFFSSASSSVAAIARFAALNHHGLRALWVCDARPFVTNVVAFCRSFFFIIVNVAVVFFVIVSSHIFFSFAVIFFYFIYLFNSHNRILFSSSSLFFTSFLFGRFFPFHIVADDCVPFDLISRSFGVHKNETEWFQWNEYTRQRGMFSSFQFIFFFLYSDIFYFFFFSFDLVWCT